MSEFVTSKRWESYLAHTSCPLGESVKRELFVAPGPDNLWLIQPLREKVMCTIKEALLLSSTASLVSILRQSVAFAREPPTTEGMLLHLTFRGPAHRVIVKNPIAIGGCLSLHWQVWSDEGAEPLGSGGLAVGDTRFPSVGLPPYPGIPSLYRRMPPVPSGAKLWRERFRLC